MKKKSIIIIIFLIALISVNLQAKRWTRGPRQAGGYLFYKLIYDAKLDNATITKLTQERKAFFEQREKFFDKRAQLIKELWDAIANNDNNKVDEIKEQLAAEYKAYMDTYTKHLETLKKLLGEKTFKKFIEIRKTNGRGNIYGRWQ